jgi:hypothetical protein
MDDLLGQPAREAFGLTKRRCTGTNHNGTRCGRAPIIGGFVCVTHGGGAPQVKDAAAKRIRATVDPVLSGFEELIAIWRDDPLNEAKAKNFITVGRDLLSRAGFAPGLALTLTTDAPTAPYLPWLPTDRLEQINVWIAEAKAAMQRGDPPADEPPPINADDAVLVDRDEPA